MSRPSLQIAPLGPADRPHWEPLVRGYKAFYGTPTSDADYDAAWVRLMAGDPVRGLGARLGDELVGIAHYLHHASVWAPSVCYLQDLFTAPSARGRGVARVLIEAIAQDARARGASRYYWLTQQQNAVARALYDRVARQNGFIRYDFPMQDGAD